MEEDEMLRNIIQDTLEDIPDSDSAVICQFFPLRSTITITIDTAQSATFDFNHVLELCTNMPTEDLGYTAVQSVLRRQRQLDTLTLSRHYQRHDRLTY